MGAALGAVAVSALTGISTQWRQVLWTPALILATVRARGTSDTRGNLACTLLAVKALKDAGVELRGELLCIYTVDGELLTPLRQTLSTCCSERTVMKLLHAA